MESQSQRQKDFGFSGFIEIAQNLSKYQEILNSHPPHVWQCIELRSPIYVCVCLQVVCLSIYVYLCLCVCFSFWVCVSARSAVSVCLCGLQSSWPTWDWAASLIWTQLATWASPPHKSTSYVTDTDHWPLHFSYLNLRYSPQIIQNLNFHHPLHWIGPPQMSLHRVPTVKKKKMAIIGQPPIWSSSWLQHSEDMKGW